MVYNNLYSYLKTLGGNRVSRKSSNPQSLGNPGSIANAMYDAQKKEITSSIAFGFSFIGAGLIAAAIGIIKYFSISSSLSDQAENYDAWAWLIIAAVGILVGVIGFISIMRSLVSLAQIGSWAKEAESHASPFQGQKLSRKVAAMNQAQSMDKPGMQSMAEESGAPKKRGFFKRGKEAKNKNNGDLYYKYNPQEKKNSPPVKAAPMMEQKFDYGINEDKKLTFADEFLKKNKRDPFAQYRKDLGISEEPEKEVQKKPQFIHSTSAVNKNSPTPSNQNSAPTQKPDLRKESNKPTEKTVLDLSVQEPSQNNKEVGFDLSLSYFAEEKALADEKALNESKDPKPIKTENNGSVEESSAGIEFSAPTETTFASETITAPSEAVTPKTEEISDEQTPEEKTTSENEVSSSSGIEITYGDHNESDDDMFFSLKTKPASVSQQPVQIQNQTQKQPQKPRDEAPVTQKSTSDSKTSSNKAPSSTVSLELDYNKNTKTEYDFSLFDEIDPKKKQTGTTAVTQSGNEDNFKKEKSDEQNSSFISDFAKGITESSDDADLLTVKLDAITENKTIQETDCEKSKSFSEMYLNKDNNKKQEEESDIIKNGTRAQRKFVDASEYDEWTCTKCGKVNQEYVGVCACGGRKPNGKKKKRK